jgi:hypothetical protein
VPVIRVSRQRPGMKHELPARPARALVGGTSPLIGAPETFALLATSDMSGPGPGCVKTRTFMVEQARQIGSSSLS